MNLDLLHLTHTILRRRPTMVPMSSNRTCRRLCTTLIITLVHLRATLTCRRIRHNMYAQRLTNRDKYKYIDFSTLFRLLILSLAHTHTSSGLQFGVDVPLPSFSKATSSKPAAASRPTSTATFCTAQCEALALQESRRAAPKATAAAEPRKHGAYRGCCGGKMQQA